MNRQKSTLATAAKLHQLHHTVKGHPQALTAPPGKSLPKATQADLDAAQRDYDEKRADFDLAPHPVPALLNYSAGAEWASHS